MFGKLKEKLKSALDIFSKKTEEQAEPEIPSSDELVEQAKDKYAAEEKKAMEEQKEDVIEVEQDEDKIELEVDQKVPTVQEVLDETFEEDKEEVEDEKEEVTEEEKAVEEETPPEPEEVKEQEQEGKAQQVKEKPPVIIEKKEAIKEEDISEKEEKESMKTETAKPEPVEEAEEEPKEDIKEEEEPKKSFFGKLKEAISTKTISEEKYDNLFWELEVVLLENNVSVEVIEKIKQDLKEELVDKPLPRDVPKKIQETLKKTMDNILTFDKVDILKKTQDKKPLIIALFGINGSGKTTSIAKLTQYFKNNGKSVVLAACDTFRAAAIQQLEEHADKLEVKMIKHDYGSDAAAVAYDAIKYAEKNKVDIVLIDTAGRLHSNTNLMDELEKVIRISKPDLKIFVGESITGNDCIEQARKFNDLVEMDGSILTKADVDEKGGAPLSIAYTIKKPILFLGVGQNYEDLEEFDSKIILERLGL